MRTTLSLLIGICWVGQGFAQQYAADALRFSQTTFGGTARFQGIAGAQTALGGDAGSFAGNPAGLGFYRQSDFTFTPAIQFSENRSTYFGKVTEDAKPNFHVSNLALVFNQTFQDYNGKDISKGWVSMSFGLGINRINNFNENRTFTGLNPNSSITQYYAESATKYGLQEGSVEEMAYDAYLINPGGPGYTGASSGNVTQTQRDDLGGAQTEWTLALSGNYSNRLYLGGGLGITSLRYSRETHFTETGIVDTNNNVSGMALDENLQVVGSGVNLKAGLIFRPTDAFRIGADIQTPTYYGLDENFSTSIETTFGQGDSTYSFDPLNYYFQYNLTTPMRYHVGMALFFQKLGFVSADVEQVDYSNARIRSSYEVAFDNDNNAAIRDNFTSALNYRLGVESRLGPLSVRGGYALYGDPYKDRSTGDRGTQTITGGLGYRMDNYYFDFAWVHAQRNSFYAPYTLDNSAVQNPRVVTEHTKNTILFTIGSRF